MVHIIVEETARIGGYRMNNNLKKINEKVTIDFSIEELEERLEAVSVTPLGTDPACACGGCVCVVCYTEPCVCNCVVTTHSKCQRIAQVA